MARRARACGFTVQVVERWNPHAKRRVDLFDAIDIVAVRPGFGVLGIQATSGNNHADRRAKAMSSERIAEWLRSGGRFEIWSAAKRLEKPGRRGGRKIWTVRREELIHDGHAVVSRLDHGDGGRDGGGAC